MKPWIVKTFAIMAFLGVVYSACATNLTLRVVLDQEDRSSTAFRRGAITLHDATIDHKVGTVCFAALLLGIVLFRSGGRN
jgi:hypothetical protein